MRRPLVTTIFIFCLLHGHALRAAANNADEFWTTEAVHTIHIRLTRQQWSMLQPSKKGNLQRLDASAMPRPTTQATSRPTLTPRNQPDLRADGQPLRPNFYGLVFAYVKAQIECDGVTLNDVGVRLRGNSSYNWGASGFRRPFKFDFNRYVESQKFLGITAFFLNNNAYDPSASRETLAYETFRRMGVPAPRTTMANVYLSIQGQLDREYLGVYALIEDIDTKTFLNKHFGSAKGMLLKPWSIRGLPYLGEQWHPYESRYAPRSNVTPDAAKRFIDFIKLVNYADDQTFASQIDNFLGVDKFLRLLAGDVMLANLDTFLFTGHNFYLYLNPKDNRFYFMPWDMNLSFANFTSAATVSQHLHLSILHPHAGEMKLIDRLLAIPGYNQLYRNHITQFMADFFNPDMFNPRIDALAAVVEKANALADQEWNARFATTQPSTRPITIPPRPARTSTGWSGRPAIGLKVFLAARVESLKAQLAGQTDGYSPAYRPTPAPPQGGLRAHPAYGNLVLTAVAVTRGTDGNEDGKLTRDEWAASIRECFADAGGTTRDGLDQTKLARTLARRAQQLVAQRRQDRPNRRPPVDPAQLGTLWAAAVWNTLENNKTTRATLDQMLAAGDRLFAAADNDQSGKIDESELLRLLDSLAAASPPPPSPTPPATRPTTTPAT